MVWTKVFLCIFIQRMILVDKELSNPELWTDTGNTILTENRKQK